MASQLYSNFSTLKSLQHGPTYLGDIPSIGLSSLTACYDGLLSFLHSSLLDVQPAYRQAGTLFILTLAGHTLLFVVISTIWYMRSFDHKLRVDRRFRRAQIRDEIVESLLGILGIGLANTVFGMLQIHGYSRLYHSMNDGPSLWYEVMQYPLAMFLTETGVYWLHRMFHLPVLYSYTHKSHHRFIISTPFSAFAFHPVEAFIMSFPNLGVPFLIPMSTTAYLILLMSSTVETILSHDSREGFHTVHHLNPKANYGQMLTVWDVVMGTYQNPLGCFRGGPVGPLRITRKSRLVYELWKRVGRDNIYKYIDDAWGIGGIGSVSVNADGVFEVNTPW